jgi:hypothetical protein
MRYSLLASAAGVVGFPALSYAEPTELLMFVTSGTTEATSTDISTYNSFVNAQAALNSALPDDTWYAVASTSSVSAWNNITQACDATCQSTVPIFLVNGTEIATSLDALVGGTLLHPINAFQSGSTSNRTEVWTGSNSGLETAAALGGGGSPTLGCACATATTTFDAFENGNGPSFLPLSLYALGVANPPVATPEPASAGLLAVGAGLISVMRRRRRAA